MLARIFNHSLHKSILDLFIFFMFLQYNHAQDATIDVDARDNYMEDIKNKMWNIIKNYGLSNLPVPDYKYRYNETKEYFGYKMVGFLYLEDGFAFDVSSFEVDSRSRNVISSGNSVSIEGIINMENMAIFQDFKIDFENQSAYQDKVNGSVIIKPDRFFFKFKIFQKYPYLEMESHVESVEVSKPYLDFNPDNALTRRVRKKFPRQADKQDDPKSILDDLCSAWKDIFTGFLEEAVARCKFPELKFIMK